MKHSICVSSLINFPIANMMSGEFKREQKSERENQDDLRSLDQFSMHAGNGSMWKCLCVIDHLKSSHSASNQRDSRSEFLFQSTLIRFHEPISWQFEYYGEN